MNDEIRELLDKAVMAKTIPFCYQCYREAPSGVCPRCGSDDLMRLLPGYGCEYGTESFYSNILSELNIEPVDTSDDAFEDYLDELYGEVKIADFYYDTGRILRYGVPGDFKYLKDEYFSEGGGEFIKIGNDLYRVEDLEEKLSELIEEVVPQVVIGYLNKKTGKSFNTDSKRTIKMIERLKKNGFRFEDFKAVIDRRCELWGDIPHLKKYLRPQTLFNAENFHYYLYGELKKEEV